MAYNLFYSKTSLIQQCKLYQHSSYGFSAIETVGTFESLRQILKKCEQQTPFANVREKSVIQLFKNISTGHGDVWHGFIDTMLPSKDDTAEGTIMIMSIIIFF